MRNETRFRVILANLAILGWLVRLYYTRRGSEPGEKVSRTRGEPLSRWPLLAFFYALMVISAFVYVFAPHRMRWASLLLPTWLRWLGVALGIVNLLLFAWVHHTLAKNWSAALVIKEEHTLVSNGPYRFVRHPMYSNLFVGAIAYFLISANWFIGAASLAFSIVVASRIGDEEALMIEEFGDEYRAYMRRTGRFLPRLSA